MMRSSVRAAFGLVLTLTTSSIAAAQVVPGTISAPDRLPGRAFNRIDFGAGHVGTRVPGPVSRPLGAMDLMINKDTGARLPEITSAPEPHGETVPCVMRTVPVNPRLKSSMPVVGVDKRADPKSVITIPTCQPRD